MSNYYVEINKCCMFCSKEHKVLMPLNAYNLWNGYYDADENYISGINIQRAWPDSSPTQREKVISGTCDACWDLHMSEKDE